MNHPLLYKYKFQESAFNITIFIFYFIMITSALGFSKYIPTYLTNMDYYFRIYICLFLIWRFNPLRSSYEFTNLDRKIAFSAGVFILTTTVLNKYLILTKNLLINNIKLLEK